MSVLLYQRPITKMPVSRQASGPSAAISKGTAVDLAQMKLKQGASVYQAAIKPARPKPSAVSSWQSLPTEAPAQPSTERPKLKFKHFTQRNQTSAAPQQTRPAPAHRPGIEQEIITTPQPRANLDVGSQHVARGNAPSIMGEMARTANPELRERDSQDRGRLTARFSKELKQALGSGFDNSNGNSTVPDFVPSHGAAIYQATGCNCVASFMGFAGTPE